MKLIAIATLASSLLSSCAVFGGEGPPTPTHVTTFHSPDGTLLGAFVTDFHTFAVAGGAGQIRSMDYWQGVPFPILLPPLIEASKMIVVVKDEPKQEVGWGPVWPASLAARMDPGVVLALESFGVTFEPAQPTEASGASSGAVPGAEGLLP